MKVFYVPGSDESILMALGETGDDDGNPFELAHFSVLEVNMDRHPDGMTIGDVLIPIGRKFVADGAATSGQSGTCSRMGTSSSLAMITLSWQRARPSYISSCEEGMMRPGHCGSGRSPSPL